MQLLSSASERQMRLVRWALLIGWLVLIVSLLLPGISLPPELVPHCTAPSDPSCVLHHQPGNRLFWGVVVPLGLLLIGVVSHDAWRRTCPLAFVSQLGRSLGWQRTREGRKGRPEVVQIQPDSWLARHHVGLQWGLLIAGLCLRLLVVNGSPLGLAALLIITLVAAIAVGWAWGGKAWCQYICPMGPVQMVLTGPRGPLGTPAHVGTTSKVTQSMCRTINAEGREQSACVACQTPCIDIDAERSFWQTLVGKRNLGWAWYSYPGLILAFFLLMEEVGDGIHPSANGLGYLRSGLWAFDAGLPDRITEPLWPWLAIPRLVLVPLLLSAAAALSVVLFQGLERLLRARYGRRDQSEARERAIQHTRLIASFTALNIFFWFADPFQGSLGPQGGQLLRSLVLVASAIALFRNWGRDQGTYRRESASESLRRQLRGLPGLEAALDGRTLESLSPQEVFTLVKAMPALGRKQGRHLYGEVMAEMLRTGRLERVKAHRELQELRQTLKLDDEDHHAVVRQLASEQPDLLKHDQLQRQADDLRMEAACEAIEDLMRLAGQQVLDASALPKDLQQRLEQLRLESDLDDGAWQETLDHFGPDGEIGQRRLHQLRDAWIQEAALAALLEERAVDDPLLDPLHRAIALRLRDSAARLHDRLERAGLEPLPSAVPAAGTVDQALDLLWNDADPDTAGWVLMLERERHQERLPSRLQDPRTGLGDSPFLQDQRQGRDCPERQELPALARCALFTDLLPSGLIWLARHGTMAHIEPGVVVMRAGESSDALAVVVEGDVQIETARGRTMTLGCGQSVGEVGLINGSPRMATVMAGSDGASLFFLQASMFEEMLQRSSRFGRGLLGQLALRLVRS